MFNKNKTNHDAEAQAKKDKEEFNQMLREVIREEVDKAVAAQNAAKNRK